MRQKSASTPKVRYRESGGFNLPLQYEKIDGRLLNCFVIAREFKLNPYYVDENWGDLQISETLSFLNEMYKKMKK